MKTIINVYNGNGVHVAKHVFRPQDAICAAVLELSNGNIIHMVNVSEASMEVQDQSTEGASDTSCLPFDHRHVGTMQ